MKVPETLKRPSSSKRLSAASACCPVYSAQTDAKETLGSSSAHPLPRLSSWGSNMGEITPKKQCQERGEQKMPLYLGGVRCASGFCPEGQDTQISIPKHLEFLLSPVFVCLICLG